MKLGAIDIGGTKIAAGVVNNGALGDISTIPTVATQGGKAVLARVIDVAKALCAAEDLDGIAIASAGVVDPISGGINSATDLMPNWAGIALAQEVQEATGRKTIAINDVHAHALGEATFGAGQGCESVLMVAVGTGVGGALVINGQLWPGANGLAGHVGHIPVSGARGIACSCGASGHLEAISSGTGLAALFAALGGEGKNGREPSGPDVIAAALAGHSNGVQAVTRSGQALGEGIAALVNVVDPAMVVISGGLATVGDIWWEPVRQGFVTNVLAAAKNTPLVAGSLRGGAPLLGAAAAWEKRM